MAQCGCHVTNTRPTWKVSYTDDNLWCYHSHGPTLCYHSHVTNTRPTWKLSYTDDNLWCYSHDPHSSLPCTHYKSRQYFFTLRSYACSLWLVAPCLWIKFWRMIINLTPNPNETVSWRKIGLCIWLTRNRVPCQTVNRHGNRIWNEPVCLVILSTYISIYSNIEDYKTETKMRIDTKYK